MFVCLFVCLFVFVFVLFCFVLLVVCFVLFCFVCGLFCLGGVFVSFVWLACLLSSFTISGNDHQALADHGVGVCNSFEDTNS